MSAVDVAIEALNGILPGFACRRLEDGRDALELGGMELGGIRIPIEGIAQHVVDDLTGSGYAVVELPDSTDTGELPDEGWWKSFPEGVSATGPNGRVFDQGADISPTEARALAAALLAAANAAEATS